ncbi:MAG: ribosome silencing factor [Candidatus Omnitrophica bacterium]|nr:ribosome silencing factor [Candidatus Omnitrophota bacterium]MBU4479492.1 ribosome silencing factor [Candidatus Omnitrophota bacterium]
MKSKALKIVSIAEEKKVVEPVILDVRKISTFCDFFVIVTGTSQMHIRSIADAIEEEMKKEGVRCNHREGDYASRWVVLDYASVVVHIFDEEMRSFYDLEHLWADASRLSKKAKILNKRKE